MQTVIYKAQDEFSTCFLRAFLIAESPAPRKKIVKVKVQQENQIFQTNHNGEVLLVVNIVEFKHGGRYQCAELSRNPLKFTAKSKTGKQKKLFFVGGKTMNRC